MPLGSIIFNVFSLSSGLGAVIVLAVLFFMFKKRVILLFLLFLLFLCLEYLSGILIFVSSMDKPPGLSMIPDISGRIKTLLILKLVCETGMFLTLFFTVHLFTGKKAGKSRAVFMCAAAGIVFIYAIGQLLLTGTGGTGDPLSFILPMFMVYAAYLYCFFFILNNRREVHSGIEATVRKVSLVGLGIIIPAMAAEEVYLLITSTPPRVVIDPLAFLFLTGATLLISVLHLARIGRGITSRQSLEEFCREKGISERESEILGLLLEGFKYKEIAAKLFISQDTVKTHISRLYRKAGATGRTDLKYRIRIFRQ